MAATTASETDFLFKVGDIEDLAVVRFRGVEAISELFRFDLELASEDGDVDFAQIVGQDATLTITDGDETRYVHGIINKFDQLGKGTHYTHYRARLVPKIWTLTLRHGCRMHTDLPVAGDPPKGVIDDLLANAGFTHNEDYKWKGDLQGRYPIREYCMQYRETDFNFFSRLLEETGIFYYFEHTEEGTTLILGDAPAHHEMIEGTSTLPFRDPGVGVSEGEQISRFHKTRQMRSEQFTLRDFNWAQPANNLTQGNPEAAGFPSFKAPKSHNPGAAQGKLEVYDYADGYIDTETGEYRARVRIEENLVAFESVQGDGNCRQMVPGSKFAMVDHPRSEFNDGEYLLLRVQHAGDQPQVLGDEAAGADPTTLYQNRFEAIPATVPFRPAKVTPKARVEGPQTGIVVGPAGEEIWPDPKDKGRVLVKFHWDRWPTDAEERKTEEHPTACWIRVSQGWAGAGWGMMFFPRIGHEVIIGFLEGNPDRPIITGRVYNGENPPPLGKAQKTQSTIKSNSSPGGGGSNEFRFEDAAGSEEVYLHGQKDWTIAIENDKNQTVGNNETGDVGNDRTRNVHNNETVTVDNDETRTVKNNRTRTVNNDESVTVNNNRTKRVDVDESVTIGSNYTESIGADKKITVSGDHEEAISGSMKLNVNGLSRTEVVTGMDSLTVAGLKTTKVGGAMSCTVVGAATERVGAKKSVQVSRTYEEKVNGDRKTAVGKNYNEEVKGDHTEFVDGDFVLHAKNLELMASEKIFISVGGVQLTLKKDGTFEIKAKDKKESLKSLKVKASGAVDIKGSKTNINS